MFYKNEYNFEASVSSILKLVVAFLVWSSGGLSYKSDTFVLYAGRGVVHRRSRVGWGVITSGGR